MEDFLLSLARRTAAVAEPGDYRQDGLLICGKCNTPKQCRIDIGGTDAVVGCMCACAEQAYEDEKAAEAVRDRQMHINSLRVAGINDHNVRGYTFSTAQSTRNIERCQRYVSRWADMLENNNGLLFWGPPGTGKTFAAACIANALIDRGVPALMTSFPRILNSGWNKSELIDQMRNYPLLVIDDLGTERESGYSLENVYMVVDERYKTGLPLIVTTNLPLDEVQNPKSIDYARIYERILEMCIPISFDGESFRKAKAEDKLRFAREVFT